MAEISPVTIVQNDRVLVVRYEREGNGVVAVQIYTDAGMDDMALPPETFNLLAELFHAAAADAAELKLRNSAPPTSPEDPLDFTNLLGGGSLHGSTGSFTSIGLQQPPPTRTSPAPPPMTKTLISGAFGGPQKDGT